MAIQLVGAWSGVPPELTGDNTYTVNIPPAAMQPGTLIVFVTQPVTRAAKPVINLAPTWDGQPIDWNYLGVRYVTVGVGTPNKIVFSRTAGATLAAWFLIAYTGHTPVDALLTAPALQGRDDYADFQALGIAAPYGIPGPPTADPWQLLADEIGPSGRWYGIYDSVVTSQEGTPPPYQHLFQVTLYVQPSPSVPPPAPPPPGMIGSAGSGSITPEWVGATRTITNPLHLTALVPNNGDLEVDSTAPQPVAAELRFNSMGTCIGGTLVFPEAPPYTPYGAAYELHLEHATGTSTWYVGIHKNMREDNGLWRVELTGPWEVFNNDAISLNSDSTVNPPVHPLIKQHVTYHNLSGRFGWEGETWGAYLNRIYAAYVNASWGITPDGTFIEGIPDYTGYATLSINDENVLSVQGDGSVLPPIVTSWYARDPDTRNLVWAHRSEDDLTSLTPRKAVSSTFDEAGALVRPTEATHPPFTESGYTLEFAGVLIPPLQVIDLPNGNQQFVASSTVRVTLGESGSMPRVTSTITTVALPFAPRSGAR